MSEKPTDPIDAEDVVFYNFVAAFQEAQAAHRPPPSPDTLSPALRRRWDEMRDLVDLLDRVGGSSEPRRARPLLENDSKPTDEADTPPSDRPTLLLHREPVPPPVEKEEARRQIGRYQIVRELGRGGMGVVYLARDPELDRLVALKCLPPSLAEETTRLGRFEVEGRLLARQQHPNIVQVHEAGEDQGRPYLVMEYVDGPSLHRHLDGRPMEPRAAAGLLETLARAVEHAHRNNILHRDLKPANVLLVSGGVGSGESSNPPFTTHHSPLTPKITDFGLATTLETSIALTRTGEVLGTPVYMAPEMAAASRDTVGPTVDVYGLGAILYETLTGRPPFVGVTPVFILSQVQFVDPVAPRQLNAQVPRDLETICLRCLQKEPGRRYSTAEALADDLQRFLTGQPILARPAGPVERAIKWARRHPGALAVWLTVATALVTILTVVLSYNFVLSGQRDEAVALGTAEKAARKKVEAQQKELEGQLIDASAALGLTAEVRNDLPLAALWFARAAEQARADPERERLNRQRWHAYTSASPVPWRAVRLPAGSFPETLLVHPDGRWLISAQGKDWRLWDMTAERQTPWPEGVNKVSAAAWHPDGRSLVAGTEDGTARLAPFPTGAAAASWKLGGPIRCAAFSRDGRFLALGGNARFLIVRLMEKDRPAQELEHPHPVIGAFFSPSGKRVATLSQNHEVRVFDLANPQKPVLGPVPHAGPLKDDVRYSMPGFFGEDELVTSTVAEVVCWNITTREVTQRLKADEFPDLPITVSPDGGSYLVRRHFRGPELWTGKSRERLDLETHRTQAQSAVYRADGKQFLLALWTGAQLWNADGTPASSVLPHPGACWPAAMSPDGRWFATLSGERLVRLWRSGAAYPGRAELPLLARHDAMPLTIANADRSLVLSGVRQNDSTHFQLHQVADGKPRGDPLALKGVLVGGVFSADGRVVYLVTQDGEQRTLNGWEWESGRAAFPPVPLAIYPLNLACSPVEPVLLFVGKGGAIEVRDAKTGGLRLARQHQPNAVPYDPLACLQLAPDGRSFVSFGFNGVAQQWSIADGSLLRTIQHPTGEPCSVAGYSADSRSLFTICSAQPRVQTWDLATGKPAGPDLPHPDPVIHAQFVLKDECLLTIANSVVRVWDWRTAKQVVPALVHETSVMDAVYSPDGRGIATIQADGVVRLWDAQTGRPLAPSWRLLPRAPHLLLQLHRLHFSGDGKSLLVTLSGKHIALLDLAPLQAPIAPTLSAEDLVLLAEINAGTTVQAGGNVVQLTSEQWLERWRSFRQRHPEFHAP